MKKNMSRVVFVLSLVTGLMASTAFAELGLQKIAANKGAEAVGSAVLAAVQAVYTNNTDPAVIQTKLQAILSEAQATGNKPAIFAAIQSVMQGASAQGAAAVGAAAQTAVAVVYAANSAPAVTQSQLSAILSGASSRGTAPANLNVAIVSVMQGATAQGTAAVGAAAQTAASVVWAGNATPAVTQYQLSLIVSTASSGGNADALRGAIVGVLVAGGTQNITLSTAAIYAGTPSNLQPTANDTVAKATPLVTNPAPTPPSAPVNAGTQPVIPGAPPSADSNSGNPLPPDNPPVDNPATPV